MMKRIMNPKMEKVVKLFLYELGIENINDVDTYHDLIKLSRILNREEDLEKLVYTILNQLKENSHSDYIQILIYLDRLEYPIASRIFGICYYEGIFYEKSYSNALISFNRAAKLGDEYSIIQSANMYFDGKGVPQDIEKAIDLYTKVAEKVPIKYQVALGKICENNNDYNKAIYWFTKAANQGDTDALFHLALMYSAGKGVAKDVQKAIKMLTKASEVGHVKSQTILGIFYSRSEDYTKAIYWLTKAANQGEGEALFRLALMYDNGDGVPKDEEKFKDLLTKASEAGHVEAKKILAMTYYNNENYTKAIYWFTEAVNQGDVDALFHLALMYSAGKGVAKDVQKEIELLTKASEAGHAKSQYILATIYQLGKVVPQDTTKALELFTKASNQGDVEAMCVLAMMYQNGKGVPQDINQAIELYTKSATLGNVYAQNTLASIYKELGDNNKSAYWSNLAKRNEDIW